MYYYRKKKQINEKVCGGLLTWSGIDLLNKIGLDPNSLLKMGAVRINQFEYIKNNTHSGYCYHSGEHCLGTTRRLFDKWLLDQAISKGTDVVFGVNFKNAVYKNNQYYVEGYSAHSLIMATGSTGFIPSSMQKNIYKQTFAISLRIKGKTLLHENSAFFFPVKTKGNDYFWIIPNGEKIWNIGIWFQNVPLDPISQFWKYKDEFVDKFFYKPSTFGAPRGGFCGNVDFSNQLPSRCYGVGDFAGKNKETTGEGLRYAIESSVMLTNSLISGIV